MKKEFCTLIASVGPVKVYTEIGLSGEFRGELKLDQLKFAFEGHAACPWTLQHFPDSAKREGPHLFVSAMSFAGSLAGLVTEQHPERRILFNLLVQDSGGLCFLAASQNVAMINISQNFHCTSSPNIRAKVK